MVSGRAGYKPRSAPKPDYDCCGPRNTFAWHLSLKWSHLLFLYLLLCKGNSPSKDSALWLVEIPYQLVEEECLQSGLQGYVQAQGSSESLILLLQGSRIRRASPRYFTVIGIVRQEPTQRSPVQHCYPIVAKENTGVEVSSYLFSVLNRRTHGWSHLCYPYWVSVSSVELWKDLFSWFLDGLNLKSDMGTPNNSFSSFFS